MKLKRNVKADRIVTPSILVAPSIINKGDEVLIVAKNRSIRIEMKGEALRNGVHGQQIPVKNLKSKRIIKAQVLSQGMVTVPL
jgi:flagella basal body P-ring formation protein FlgA